MDVKKFVLAWVIATVVGFLLSGGWHVVVMADFYGTHMEAVARPEAEVDMVMIFLGYVVLGLLMAYVFPIGAKGGPPVAEGFRFGAVIGLLWVLPWSLIIVGIWNVGLTVVLVDSGWHVVEQGIAGIGVAYAYRSTA